MKNNPLVYIVAIAALVIASALLFPGQTTSSKSNNATSVSSNRARHRTLSRSVKGGNASISDTEQLPELSLPGKHGEKMRGQKETYVSTTAMLFPQQPADTSKPQSVAMVGPVSLDGDLRALPDIPQVEREDEQRLNRYPSVGGAPGVDDPLRAIKTSAIPQAMPTPLATFAGITSAQSACGCLPPDTDGDVGNSYYIQAVNSRFKILDRKSVV